MTTTTTKRAHLLDGTAFELFARGGRPAVEARGGSAPAGRDAVDFFEPKELRDAMRGGGNDLEEGDDDIGAIEVCGESSAGKSHLMIRAAARCASSGHTCLYFDLDRRLDPQTLLAAVNEAVSSSSSVTAETATDNIIIIRPETPLDILCSLYYHFRPSLMRRSPSIDPDERNFDANDERVENSFFSRASLKRLHEASAPAQSIRLVVLDSLLALYWMSNLTDPLAAGYPVSVPKLLFRLQRESGFAVIASRPDSVTEVKDFVSKTWSKAVTHRLCVTWAGRTTQTMERHVTLMRKRYDDEVFEQQQQQTQTVYI